MSSQRDKNTRSTALALSKVHLFDTIATRRHSWKQFDSTYTSVMSEISLSSKTDGSSALSKSERYSPEISKQRQSTLTFPPCVICDGKASGTHYGCNTCEACKNFFRRYLIRTKPSVCSKQNDCNVYFRNKGNCSACRLAKCLHFGMSRSKSKLGRYTYSRRTETIQKVKQLEQKEFNATVADMWSTLINDGIANTCVDCIHSSGSTDESITERSDQDLVDALTQYVAEIRMYGNEMEDEEVINAKFKAHHESYKAKVNMFGSLNAVPMEEYKYLLKQYGIDIGGQFESSKRISKLYEDILNRYFDFAKKIPGFKQLSYNDQAGLLKATHHFAFTLLRYKFYSPEHDVFIKVNGEAFHMEELADKFVTRGYMKLFCNYAIFLQKLDLTKKEIALLIVIATFSPDVCTLENTKLVETFQMKYVDLLTWHLNSIFNQREAAIRLAKLLDVLTRMRDLLAIYYQETTSLSQDDLLSSVFPLIHELVPESY